MSEFLASLAYFMSELSVKPAIFMSEVLAFTACFMSELSIKPAIFMSELLISPFLTIDSHA